MVSNFAFKSFSVCECMCPSTGVYFFCFIFGSFALFYSDLFLFHLILYTVVILDACLYSCKRKERCGFVWVGKF